MPPLTPAQIAENDRIKDLPVIGEIKDNQNGMKESINELSKIIENEQNQNNTKFNKIETKIAELEDTMNNGLNAINSSLIGLKTEIKDDKITKLQNQITKRDDNDKDGRKTKVLFIQAVVVMGLSVFLTALFANVPSVTIAG